MQTELSGDSSARDPASKKPDKIDAERGRGRQSGQTGEGLVTESEGKERECLVFLGPGAAGPDGSILCIRSSGW